MKRLVKGRRASNRASGRVRAHGGLARWPLGLVVLLLLGCGQPEPDRLPTTRIESPYAAAIDEARALLDSIIDAEAIPGLSAAIGRGSQLIWSEGFGYSDMTHNVMVTPLTKFRIGSVSKPVTAAALAILVEAGALDLDAPVQDYVPSFPEKRWPVTTRQLAGHLGGIRHYRGLENLSRTHYPTVLSGIAIFADDSLIHEPGTEFSYSSYGWNLVSAVVEGASGEDFLGYMDRVVFDPLGMDRTVADWNAPIIADRTRFYVADSTGQVFNAPYVDNSYKWAGGGILSTPEDLLVFANAHLEAGYLQAETLRDALHVAASSGWNRNGLRRRLALNHERARRKGRVAHGGVGGGRTVLTLNRDTGLIVAIVANLSGAPISNALAGRVEELFRSEPDAN